MNLLTSRPQTHQTSFEFLSVVEVRYFPILISLEASVYSFILRSPTVKRRASRLTLSFRALTLTLTYFMPSQTMTVEL